MCISTCAAVPAAHQRVSRAGASRVYTRVLNAYAQCRGRGYRGRRCGCQKRTHVLRVYAAIEGVGKCEDSM